MHKVQARIILITAFNGEKHTILFDDGEDNLKLSDETFRIRAAP